MQRGFIILKQQLKRIKLLELYVIASLIYVLFTIVMCSNSYNQYFRENSWFIIYNKIN